MFIDARSVPSGSKLECDVCIVGAGAAGIALALELDRGDLDLCLLESGGLALEWQQQALAQGDSVGAAYSPLDSAQLRFFGGNTNAWGGWFRALDEIDFKRRLWVPESGWPFPAGELAPHLERAHAFCRVPSSDYAPAAVSALGDPAASLLPLDPTRLESVLYRFSPPARFNTLYREAVERSQRIKCLLHAHALGLCASHDARMVTAVKIGSLDGNRLAVSARIVILAAGAIENARLLLLSNDVAPAGLGNERDLVGRYLMDHPHTRRPILRGPRRWPLGVYGLAFRGRGLCAGLSLPEALQQQEALLNYKASIYPVLRGQDSAAWRGFRDLALKLSRKWGADPYDRFRLPFARKQVGPKQVLAMLARGDQVVLGALAQLLKSEMFVGGLELESKPEQSPNRASRVTLQPERDAFGLPRARIDWRLLPIDRRTVVRAEEIIDGEFQRLGVGRLAPLAPEERESWPPDFAGGWHQMGTTRAHADPRHGVVDAQCRVHGVGNLFIAGASVFPTGGSVSPTPTLLALAFRLAAHVRSVLASPLSRRVAAATFAGAAGTAIQPAS
jgi:choline dehydrogenase-like flavoprotein